jgi:hypothetical protein
MEKRKCGNKENIGAAVDFFAEINCQYPIVN